MKEKNTSALAAYFFVILFALILIPTLALFGALILSRLSDPMGAVGVASLGTLLLSAIIAGLVAPKIRKEGWGAVCISASATIALIIATVSSVLSDGTSILGSLLSATTYIALFMTAAALSQRKKKRRRKKR